MWAKPMGERAQSNLIGAVLLIGILTAAVGSTLGVVVPQEGEQAEIDHRSEIETDMVDLRNQINNAVDGEGPRAETIRFGVDYPAIVERFAYPSPSEAVRYEDMGEAELYDDSGTEISSTESGLVTYDPSLGYTDRGPMYIENSVYHRTDGIAQTEQQLIRGKTVRMVGTTADLGVTQSDPYVIDVVPGNTVESYHQLDRIEFPSRLSASEWRELLSAQLSSGNVDSVSKSGDTVTVELDSSVEYRVLTSEVGLNKEPSSGRRIDAEARDTVNPYQINGMILQSMSISGSDVNIEFENPTGTTDIVAVRANFFKSIGGGPPGPGPIREFDVETSANTHATNIEFGDDTTVLSPNVQVSGTQTVTLNFDNNVNSNQEFFMITITVGDGQRAQYIIG